MVGPGITIDAGLATEQEIVMNDVQGWMPEIDDIAGERRAHWVPPDPHLTFDRDRLALVAQCGAHCYPHHGTDTDSKIAQHKKCARCEAWPPCPVCADPAT